MQLDLMMGVITYLLDADYRASSVLNDIQQMSDARNKDVRFIR